MARIAATDESTSAPLGTPEKADGRSNRLGRFEIVITDLRDADGHKYGTGYHMRWRADGNRKIVSTTEVFSSKRNALRSVELQPGVTEVRDGQAVLADGAVRDIVIMDLRGEVPSVDA